MFERDLSNSSLTTLELLYPKLSESKINTDPFSHLLQELRLNRLYREPVLSTTVTGNHSFSPRSNPESAKKALVTEEDLFRQAQDPMFRQLTRWMLRLTEGKAAPETGVEPDGVREYAFVGYKPNAQPEDLLTYTRMFRGEKGSIDTRNQYTKYLDDNGVCATPHVAVHSHPHHLNADAEGLEPYASVGDLFSLQKWADSNPAIQYCIGVSTPTMDKQLLLGFQSVNARINFDPAKVYLDALDQVITGRTPYRAYRDAGLAVAVVDVTQGVSCEQSTYKMSNKLDEKQLAKLNDTGFRLPISTLYSELPAFFGIGSKPSISDLLLQQENKIPKSLNISILPPKHYLLSSNRYLKRELNLTK